MPKKGFEVVTMKSDTYDMLERVRKEQGLRSLARAAKFLALCYAQYPPSMEAKLESMAAIARE